MLSGDRFDLPRRPLVLPVALKPLLISSKILFLPLFPPVMLRPAVILLGERVSFASSVDRLLLNVLVKLAKSPPSSLFYIDVTFHRRHRSNIYIKLENLFKRCLNKAMFSFWGEWRKPASRRGGSPIPTT